MSQSLSIIKNGENISGKGIKASEEILKEQLPDINMQLLSNIVILGQGLPNRFTGNTPSGRKEILEKLFKTDFMIDDIKNRINNRLLSLKDELRVIEDNVISTKSRVSVIREKYDQDCNELENLENVDELKKRIDNNREILLDLENTLREINTNNQSNIEFNNKINDKILELTQSKVTINNSDYLEKEIEDIKEKGTNLKNEISILDKEIKDKDNIVDICPTCGQKLVNVEKPDTSKDKEKLARMNSNLDKLRAEFKDLSSKRKNKISEDLNKIDAQISELKSSIKDISDTRSIELDIQSKRDIDKSLDMQLNEYCNKENTLKENIKKNKSEIEKLDSHMSNLLTEKIKLESKIDVDNKINTLIKRDFRGYLLSGIISLLDKTIKEYSENIFNHNNISISQDGNSISVKLNNKVYEQLSGGERSKVDICLQIALREVLCKYTNVYSNILAIDEIFDGLDESGSENILNLISTKLSIPSVFIVTHRKDFDMPMDSKIIVKKNNKGSVAIQF